MRTGARAILWLAFVGSVTAPAAFGGCTLSREGTLPQNCSDARACDDTNPCTLDACGNDGVCTHDDLPDGTAPDALQVAGDCQLLQCTSGASTQLYDPGDFDDDHNSCTTDACSTNGATHTPFTPNAACVDANGNDGKCVPSTTDPAGISCQALCTAENAGTQCNNHNDCTLDSCDIGSGVCANAPLNEPAPTQTAGDCTALWCIGGVATPVADDNDRPTAPNDCALVGCSEGTPTMTPLAIGAPCVGGVCNGDGTSPACVECNFAGDCSELPVDTECQQRACQSGSCAVVLTPVDTPVGLQTPGDCKVVVCTGSGGTKSKVDPSDPNDDGNDCTTDGCDAQGNPTHPTKPLNTPCGATTNPGHCTAAGVCGCTDVTQCPASTHCRTSACSGGVCTITPAHPNGPLPAGEQTPNDCLERRCDTSGNIVEAVIDDPPADDANACTLESSANGVPTVSPAALDTVCQTTKFCDGGGICVECNATGQCDKTGCGCSTCNGNACSDVAAAAQATCQATGDCTSEFCDGLGGTLSVVNLLDVPVDDKQCTLDLCSITGKPSNPNAPDGTPCSENGGNWCKAGACVECFLDLHCNLLTESCDTASHTCKLDLGQGCSDGTTCESGNCADGVCCDTTCTGTCKACNLSGTIGTCTNVATDQTPDIECGAVTLSCKGGACKTIDGPICGGNGDCVSGHCVDGVCCNTTCSTDCWACVQSKTGQPDGTCSFVTSGTDPDDDCTGHQCCGSGSCGGNAC